MNTDKTKTVLRRRDFLHSAAAAGAGLMLSPVVLGQAGRKNKSEDINVALIGAGEQGKMLMMDCLKIPGVRFKAVCDIWPYNRNWVSGRLRAYRQQHNCYEDYKEMLDKENDLDAAIIATPDCWHAEHTIACLEAGLHVYCEAEMSNTLQGAQRMVQAARETGRLLQIGRQRRSACRYIYCYQKVLNQARALGRIVTGNAYWYRRQRSPRGCPRRYEVDMQVLKKYGYGSMEQFRNWRWYKRLGAGPMANFGSHQIDIYNWFLQASPTSVIASGGTDYYDKKMHQWYDTIMAIYEYQSKQGTVRVFYQTIPAETFRGYYETFTGEQATLVISQHRRHCKVYPEIRKVSANIETWAKLVESNYLNPSDTMEELIGKYGLKKAIFEYIVQETPPRPERPYLELPVNVDKPYHQPHLENFFGAVRGKAKLNCPAEVGYETAVTVLKVNEAVQQGRKVNFEPGEFNV